MEPAKQYSIKIFDAENEVVSYDNLNDVIVFGTKPAEGTEKVQIFMFNGEQVSNSGLYILIRTILDKFDDGMSVVLTACATSCGEQDTTEILGEVEVGEDDLEEDDDEEDSEWDTAVG